MNKTFTILLFLLSCFTISFAQDIPNGGFEEWENILGQDMPKGWVTGGMKSLDKHGGNYALKLKTAPGDDGSFEGIALTASIMQENYGFPTNVRPLKISFYY